MQSEKIKSILESLLFVARKSLSPRDLEEVMGVPRETVKSILEELVADYQNRGININRVAGGYLMGTNSENADYVYNLLHFKVKTTLTAPALETLAIIAYKQPVTKTEVERIRGVNSDGPVETLLHKKLIEELGRSETVGRPYLYGTTVEFLRHFGLKDLADLPPLPATIEGQEGLFKTALQE